MDSLNNILQIDSLKTVEGDTLLGKKTIKAFKLVPAKKINSEIGAMIPPEAMEWTLITPGIKHTHEKVEKPDFSTYYIWIGAVVIIALICIKIILNKRKASK